MIVSIKLVAASLRCRSRGQFTFPSRQYHSETGSWDPRCHAEPTMVAVLERSIA